MMEGMKKAGVKPAFFDIGNPRGGQGMLTR